MRDGPRENIETFTQMRGAFIAPNQEDWAFDAGVGVDSCPKVLHCDVIGDLPGGEAFQLRIEADEDADHSRLASRQPDHVSGENLDRFARSVRGDRLNRVIEGLASDSLPYINWRFIKDSSGEQVRTGRQRFQGYNAT